MLAKATAENNFDELREEWAIHDYEGFGTINLGEYENIDDVVALATLISEHGDAFAAWYSDDPSRADDVDAMREAFEEAYQGEYDSLADYAQQLAEDIGALTIHSMFDKRDDRDLSSECPFTYIDWNRAGNELVLGGNIWTAPTQSYGIYVFRNV